MTNERMIYLISVSIGPRWQLSSALSSINKSFEWILRRCVSWSQTINRQHYPNPKNFYSDQFSGKINEATRMLCFSDKLCPTSTYANLSESRRNHIYGIYSIVYTMGPFACILVQLTIHFDLLSNYNKIVIRSFIWRRRVHSELSRRCAPISCFSIPIKIS